MALPVRSALIALVASLVLAACASGAGDDRGTSSDQEFPEVLDATLQADDGGTWTAAVTLSSPYDSPERYADAWRVSTTDGEELVVRVLTHDHANEQPFTRSQSGFTIPEDVTVVIVEARDLANGWGPSSLQVDIPR